MDVETLQSIASIANSLTVAGILLFWVNLERRRADTAWSAIQEDWQRQREREISRQDAKNGGGSGLQVFTAPCKNFTR